MAKNYFKDKRGNAQKIIKKCTFTILELEQIYAREITNSKTTL